MKKSGRLERTTPLKRTPMRPRRTRSVIEFARIYGSPERTAWIEWLPCVACSRVPCENHHIKGEGTSRKAAAKFIVPLCATCHDVIHDIGRDSFEALHSLSLAACAERTDAAWHAHQGET